MKQLTTITILCMVLLLHISACKKSKSGGDDEVDTTNKPETLKHYEAFKATSPFYNKIAADAEVDPNSATMVQSLVDQESSQGFLISVKEWTVSVFFADENTPLETVSFQSDWAPFGTLQNVPIPNFATPDPSEDGHMVIIDEDGGCVFDFWETKYSNGSWKAGWGNALPLASNGIFPKGLSARGSGFELLQGVMWPKELENGTINHALIFSYDHTKAGGPVSPATESDGTSIDDWAIPEGALVQLDPSLDLSTLGLNSYEMTIAKALQEYGMYCADDGGGISLYAINPNSSKTNPYLSIWGDESYVYLDKIPVDKFRVLKLPQQTNEEAQIISNACNNYN